MPLYAGGAHRRPAGQHRWPAALELFTGLGSTAEGSGLGCTIEYQSTCHDRIDSIDIDLSIRFPAIYGDPPIAHATSHPPIPPIQLLSPSPPPSPPYLTPSPPTPPPPAVDPKPPPPTPIFPAGSMILRAKEHLFSNVLHLQ